MQRSVAMCFGLIFLKSDAFHVKRNNFKGITCCNHVFYLVFLLRNSLPDFKTRLLFFSAYIWFTLHLQ